jgi:hypothetical protein
MKTCYLLFFLLFSTYLFAQAPSIQFQKTIGGSNNDFPYSILETTDGGYIAAGYSKSNISGDKTQNCSGLFDYWVVKGSATGTILWQKTIGGSGGDTCIVIKQTNDGGYILGGTSNSPISGDKTENSKGVEDYWIVKLNTQGDIEWDKTIGGNSVDDLLSIDLTTDGGYILGGRSNSPISGDKTQNFRTDLTISNGSHEDFWIVKINSTGIVLWDKTIGGDSSESPAYIKQTVDGGYIVGGTSVSSNSYEKSENSRGGSDYWILKLDEFGSILWQKTIGGSQTDNFASLQQTIDGGYIIGGSSYSSISGEKTEDLLSTNILDSDIWILKLDALGNIVWQNTIGGVTSDSLSDLKQTVDGGYIIGGYSNSSISYDKSENSKGFNDFWLVKLNSLGVVQWDKTIGGSSGDGLYSLQQTNDQGFLLVGISTSSISGDKNENCRGIGDFWVVKLNPENLAVNQNNISNLQIYPNPTTGIININFEQTQEKVKITLINILGQVVSSKTFFQTQMETYTITGECGIYFLTFENEKREKKTIKIIKR